MGNFFFPQLSSGAIAQYPIKKSHLVRTVKNVLPDGNMLLFRDANGSHKAWQLAYRQLAGPDANALQAHFSACSGRFRGFTFIDPTDNMLAWSSDFKNSPWQSPPLLQLTPGVADPEGGMRGFAATNTGQATLQISQTLAVPANYQFCFSVYAQSYESTGLVLSRSGSSDQAAETFSVGPVWTRLISSGQLNDAGTRFTVAISVAAGQRVALYGVQLESQVSPSRYRPTAGTGGVYANAHWGIDQLTMTAEAPNLFSTAFSIETVIRG